MDLYAKSKIYTMRLFDGKSDGLIEIELGEQVNCYKFSKEFFDVYKDDKEIKRRKSVYILFGQGKFYIGKSGMRNNKTAISSRIKEHLKDPQKDFIEEIIFFCDRNNNWNGGELQYLEASLIKYCKDQGFPFYKNQKYETIDTDLSRDEKFIYEKHLNEIKIMLDVLGYKTISSLQNRNALLEMKEEEEKDNNKHKPNKRVKSDKKALFLDTSKAKSILRTIPPLDETIESVCTFVEKSMRKLADSGFEFTDEEYKELCDKRFTAKTFKCSKSSHLPFFSLTREGNLKERYWSKKFHFGNKEFYLMSQWSNYDGSRENFVNWYKTLGKIEK